MPSVIATITRMPASAASMIASAANGGGTKIIDGVGAGVVDRLLHRVEDREPNVLGAALARRHAADELRAVVDGTARRGTCPALPVMPWQITFVFLLTRMLMLSP